MILEMGYEINELETVLILFREIRFVNFSKPEPMTLFKNLIILYIYLRNKILHLIKTGKIHSIISSEEDTGSEKVQKKGILHLFLRAIVTSFLVFFTMVYIHQGSLIFNADGSTIFNVISAFEFSATIVFLFLVFVVHRGISNLMNDRKLQNFSSLAKGVFEALLVVMTSVFFLFVVLYLPFTLIFPDVDVPMERVRFNNVIMAIITLFFYYFVERERSKKQLQEQMLRTARLQKENFQAQLKSLKDQVSPHFLFNSLNVLSSLIQQDTKKATEFTEKLADLYRLFLKNSHQQLIPLQKELEVVNSYVYLLKTRFGESIKFQVNIEREKEQLQLPPGSIQMLIENAIKHNGSTKMNPLIITIFTQESSLIIQNNRQPRKDQFHSTKTGLENIKRRYSFFTNTEVKILETKNDFTVQLPLLKVNE